MSHYCASAEAKGRMPCGHQCDECYEHEHQRAMTRDHITPAERLYPHRRRWPGIVLALVLIALFAAPAFAADLDCTPDVSLVFILLAVVGSVFLTTCAVVGIARFVVFVAGVLGGTVLLIFDEDGEERC